MICFYVGTHIVTYYILHVVKVEPFCFELKMQKIRPLCFDVVVSLFLNYSRSLLLGQLIITKRHSVSIITMQDIF